MIGTINFCVGFDFLNGCLCWTSNRFYNVKNFQKTDGNRLRKTINDNIKKKRYDNKLKIMNME